jgi:hypothetical protein
VDYCVAAGIKKELIVPYNPQQNGVAERKNRTVVGLVRAKIHDQGLPKFLWVEACHTVVYLQNRSPHTVLGKLTPEEVFTGTKPDVSHIRIWGNVCYCRVPSEKRTKLDPIAEKGLLVGFLCRHTRKSWYVGMCSSRRSGHYGGRKTCQHL